MKHLKETSLKDVIISPKANINAIKDSSIITTSSSKLESLTSIYCLRRQLSSRRLCCLSLRMPHKSWALAGPHIARMIAIRQPKNTYYIFYQTRTKVVCGNVPDNLDANMLCKHTNKNKSRVWQRPRQDRC